jgi:hypothetical protein
MITRFKVLTRKQANSLLDHSLNDEIKHPWTVWDFKCNEACIYPSTRKAGQEICDDWNKEEMPRPLKIVGHLALYAGGLVA